MHLHPVTRQKVDADAGVSPAVEQEGEVVFEGLPGHRRYLNAVAAQVALAADGASCAVLCEGNFGRVGPRNAIRTRAVRAAAADVHVRVVAQALVGLVMLLRGDAIGDGQACLGGRRAVGGRRDSAHRRFSG